MIELIKNHKDFKGFESLTRQHCRRIFQALKSLKKLRCLDVEEYQVYKALSNHF